jgi:large subunit ribosomal protein L23
MNVELAEPFQWPEAPTDLQPWSNDLFKQREARLKENRKEQYARQTMKLGLKSKQPLSAERKELADLAKKMLSGEVPWKNDVHLDPKWDSFVKNMEAKQGVHAEALKAKESNTSPQEPSS